MSKPIRVLQIVYCMQNDGVANVIMNAYRNIDRSKVQFDFLMHNLEPKFFDDEIESLGGRIFRIEDFDGKNEEKYINDVNNVLDNNSYEIVHGHWGRCPHLYFKAAKDHGCIVVNHSHNLMPKLPTEIEERFAKIYKTAAENSDYYLACSRHVAVFRFGEDIVEHSKNYHFFPNGIDNKLYKYDEKARAEIAEEFNLDNNIHLYGHVGRFMQYQKNHEFLIDVFNEIIKLEPNAKLMLVGEGEDKPAIENKVKDLGITDSVIFTGVRGDVRKLLQRMDCFILTSYFEGCPVVGVEALSASLPCLFSKAMPPELAITDTIYSMDLDEGATKWAEKAVEMAKIPRDKKINGIVAEKFNIYKTAKWLQEFYLEIAKN